MTSPRSAIRKGVDALVARQVAAIKAEMDAKLAQALEPIKHKEAMSEADSHFGAIEGTPRCRVGCAIDAMEKWIENHPSYARPALRAVIERRYSSRSDRTARQLQRGTGEPANPLHRRMLR